MFTFFDETKCVFFLIENGWLNPILAAVFTGSHHKAPIGASGCSNAWHGWARMRPADSRTGEAAPWSLFPKNDGKQVGDEHLGNPEIL